MVLPLLRRSSDCSVGTASSQWEAALGPGSFHLGLCHSQRWEEAWQCGLSLQMPGPSVAPHELEAGLMLHPGSKGLEEVVAV